MVTDWPYGMPELFQYQIQNNISNFFVAHATVQSVLLKYFLHLNQLLLAL